jgi:hypothetical protein
MKLLTLLVILASLSQVDPVVYAVDLKNKPHVEQDNEEVLEDISFVKSLINAVFEGLGLNDFLGGEEACFDDLEVMLWYYYYSYEGIFESSQVYNGTLSLTKALGQASPVLRKCYTFSEENEA